MLYSYKGQEPTTLPFRIRLDEGSTITSLNELSSEELESLGFVGPIIKPEIDENIQKIVWVGDKYQVIELTEEEISQKDIEKEERDRIQKLQNIDYNHFWELLSKSSIYKKLRAGALQSLAENTIFTEMIALFGDAKMGNPNVEMIQKYINILFLNFQLTKEEIKKLQDFMNETNLEVLYTLPDEEYLSSHNYYIETNTIIKPPPFESWILVKDNWESPIAYPTDGKTYNWNEEELNWIAIN